jgi:hypothetical protein
MVMKVMANNSLSRFYCSIRFAIFNIVLATSNLVIRRVGAIKLRPYVLPSRRSAEKVSIPNCSSWQTSGRVINYGTFNPFAWTIM